MIEYVIVAVGALCLLAALVKAGAPTVSWILFRLRLSRLLTVVLTLIVIAAVITKLRQESP